MPQKIICGGCGEVFYEGTNLKPPEELIQQLKGTCPKCGRKLHFDPRNVEIKGATGGNKG